MHKNIKHKYKSVQQNFQACVQDSLSILLSHYDTFMTPEEIETLLPTYKKDGKILGTSIGHALYFLQSNKFDVEVLSADIGIFDFSWADRSNKEMIVDLTERLPHLVHHTYKEDEFEVIIDGYKQFLANHGRLIIDRISISMLDTWIQQGPVFAVVSYQYLHKAPKQKYISKQNAFVPDPISSYQGTHAVVIVGMEDQHYILADPDYERGGEKKYQKDTIIGAIIGAQADFDCCIARIKPIAKIS